MLKKILKFRSIIESLIELQIYNIVSRKRKVWKDQIYSKIDEKERETLVAEWNKYRITCASNTLLNPFQVKKKKKIGAFKVYTNRAINHSDALNNITLPL